MQRISPLTEWPLHGVTKTRAMEAHAQRAINELGDASRQDEPEPGQKSSFMMI